ncbi:CLIP domain-containing serine protease B10-like [Topomyia yanbarensis]|uniref:CLIP domain-containing serine protease B10-like n=1 Tax=Topomyia yanbarensis TaxID=2498891 RepID=UPI00273B6DF0|nr:CLIP domain-containing serine protease B10-like [Topomyia yanbarensis]
MISTVLLLSTAALSCVLGQEVFRNAQFQCGIPKHANTLLIVNGADAKISDWPWHAAVRQHSGNQPEYVCGGTLISEWFVVTAAHCTLGENPNKLPTMSVQLGVNAVGSAEGKVYNVGRIHRHHGFALPDLKDDIALLELSSPVEFNDFVLPICTSKKTETVPGKVGAIVGWGVTENDIPSTKLKLAKLPVVDELECKRREPELYGRVLTDKVFCAGYTNGTSACNGDSGGGIVFERGDAWYLGGITSFTRTRDGSNLCLTTTYAAFTKITPYLDWIARITNIDFSDEYGIEKIVPCSTPAQPNGVCVPVQQCRNIFDALRSPLLSKNTADQLRQTVCQLRGIRRSVCCTPDQVERIHIHRNAILLPLECGVAKRSTPTSTAVPANVFEFPWIALVLSSKVTPHKKPYCIGTLINNRYVLTEGSCLMAKENAGLDYVRLGEHTLDVPIDCDIYTDPRTRNSVEECAAPPLDVKLVLPFIFHPQQNKPLRANDFGLVRLEHRITFTDNIRPICLPVREDLRNTFPKDFILTVMETTTKQELYKTRSEFVEAEECDERYEDYSYSPWLTDRMFCALAKGPNFVCTPHMGAPLISMIPQGGTVRAVMYGMAMWNPSNCTIAQTIPKTYHRMPLYVDWILENIAP